MNRVHRVMKEHGLLVTNEQRLRANRSKPRAHRPNHYGGIAMTEIKIFLWGWLYLCIVLDWCTTEIIGYPLSMTDDWLDALAAAVNNRSPQGIRETLKDQQLFLLSDNGCQPTSQRFMMNCSVLGVTQICTTMTPRRYFETFNGHIKEPYPTLKLLAKVGHYIKRGSIHLGRVTLSRLSRKVSVYCLFVY